MAAANTDKFMEVGVPGTATTLAAPGHSIAGTSINVVSTTNWPTATGVAFAMDRVELVNGVETRVAGSYTEWVGVVTGATSIASLILTYGTDQTYASGALTRVYIPVSSTHENRLVQGIVVQHKQDGTHANTITTDTINENTAANGVTIDGVKLKDAKLATNNSVVTSNITNASVTADKLATGAAVSNISTSETTTSTSFAGLTTAQAVTVTVGANGLALVAIKYTGGNNGADGQTAMSFALSGANTLAALSANEVRSRQSTANAQQTVGATMLLTALTPGSTTFTAQFSVTANTGTFLLRSIAVVPL